MTGLVDDTMKGMARTSAACERRGILLADISDWEAPGILYGKPAMQCTAQEIKDEV